MSPFGSMEYGLRRSHLSCRAVTNINMKVIAKGSAGTNALARVDASANVDSFACQHERKTI